MSWIYQGKEFEELDIPAGAVGFIYIMTAIIDGKSVAYIGKKNFPAFCVPENEEAISS